MPRNKLMISLVVASALFVHVLPANVFAGTNLETKGIVPKVTPDNSEKIKNEVIELTEQDSVYSPEGSADSLPIGDVDGNGTINSLDFAYMRMYLLGTIKDFKPDDDLWVSDVNGDDTFNSIDFAFMRQFLLGSINEFPKQRLPKQKILYVEENGDTIDTAIDIELSDKMNGKVDHVGDYDYFAFTPSKMAVYIINTQILEGSVNEILLYEFQGESKSYSRIIDSKNSYPIKMGMDPDQTYYLAIGHNDNLASYIFNITQLQDDHGNDFETATSLNCGPSEGNLESIDDVDFFSFMAPNSGDYTITTQSFMWDMNYCVYDSYGNELFTDIPGIDEIDSSRKRTFQISFEGNKTYYIKVKTKSLGAFMDYSISISPK